jgi:hypothetical protein
LLVTSALNQICMSANRSLCWLSPYGFFLSQLDRFARRSPNPMERRMTINHRIGDQALIKGGQLTSMRAGECEEIAISDLKGLQQASCIHSLWNE